VAPLLLWEVVCLRSFSFFLFDTSKRPSYGWVQATPALQMEVTAAYYFTCMWSFMLMCMFVAGKIYERSRVANFNWLSAVEQFFAFWGDLSTGGNHCSSWFWQLLFRLVGTSTREITNCSLRDLSLPLRYCARQASKDNNRCPLRRGLVTGRSGSFSNPGVCCLFGDLRKGDVLHFATHAGERLTSLAYQ